MSNENQPGGAVAAAFDASTSASPPDAKPAKRKRRFFGFFWLGAELRQARAELRDRPRNEVRVIQYVRALIELGDRTLNPVDRLRAGQESAIAVALYSEALRAALRCLGSEAAERFWQDPALRQSVGEDEARERVRALATETSPALELGAGREISRADARAMQRATHHALTALSAPEQRIRKLLLKRWFRTGLSLVLMCGAIVTAAIVAIRLNTPPNLLKGKTWRTSSTYPTFSWANHDCDGHSTQIFFHTAEEASPWIEYDLGVPTRFSQIEVENRADCCADRAIPLVLEASDDRSTWALVARRTEPFSYWSAEFPPTTARYIRLRLEKTTWFHLERVVLR